MLQVLAHKINKLGYNYALYTFVPCSWISNRLFLLFVTLNPIVFFKINKTIKEVPIAQAPMVARTPIAWNLIVRNRLPKVNRHQVNTPTNKVPKAPQTRVQKLLQLDRPL
jgi:hypothetical protein